MSDDRKRLMISIAAALILHTAVLILTGMNSLNYEITPEYGPITVEISLDKPTIEPPPEPEPEVVPERELAAVETNDSAGDPSPEPVPVPAPPAEPVAKPKPAPAPKTAPAPAVNPEPAAPASPRTYTAASDDDILANIRSNRDSGKTVDARQAFGDDLTPPSTDRSDTWAASGTADGSEVVLTEDRQPVRQTPSQPRVAEPEDKPLIDRSVFSSLDNQLSSGSQAGAISADNAASQAAASGNSAGNLQGQAYEVAFNNPSASRKLLQWAPPEIPEDVQKAGISRYTVQIEFDIDSDGFTSGFYLKKTSGDSRIDAAVQSVLRGWVFEDSSSSAVKNVRATLTYVIEIK